MKPVKKPEETTEVCALCLPNPFPQPILNTLEYLHALLLCYQICKGVEAAGQNVIFCNVCKKRGFWVQGSSRLEHIWWLSLGSGGLLGTEPTPVLAQNQEAPSTAVTG